MNHKIERLLFDWKIANISAMSADGTLSCEFRAHPGSVVIWQLEIFRPMERRGKLLLVFLRMKVPGLTVRARFKISGTNQSSNTCWFNEAAQYVFKENEPWQTTKYFKDARGSFQVQGFHHFEECHINCEMFYLEELNYLPYSYYSSLNLLKLLSSDLERVFTSGTLSDVNLIAEDETFHTHKAILYARFPPLRQVLEDLERNEEAASGTRPVPTIRHNEYKDAELVKHLLWWAYTGYLYIPEHQDLPPLQLYDYSFKNGLDIFHPFHYRGSGTTECLRTARNIFFHKEGGIPISRPFRLLTHAFAGPEDIQWKLRAEVNRVDSEPTSYKILFYLKPKNTGRILSMKVGFRLQNVRGENSLMTWSYGTIPRGETMKTIFPLSQREFGKYTMDGTLRVECRLCPGTGDSIYQPKETDYFLPDLLPKRLQKLSNDMLDLTGDQHFIDVILRTGGSVYHAHKFILSARSPYFKRIFANEPVVYMFNLNEFSEEILKYIYTGTINLNYELSLTIGRQSTTYELEQLRRKCEDIIRVNQR